MQRISALTTILAIGLIQTSSGLSENERKLVSANNNFALRLLKILPSYGNKNVFFSPYSLSTALGMAYAGARGTTQNEMSQAIGYTQAGLDDDDVLEAFAHQNNRLQSESARVGIDVANSAAVQEGFPILEAYYAALNHIFKAHLLKLDFAHKRQEAVEDINACVKRATHDKIETLFEYPIRTDTKLLLLNAIVFKGLWASQFDRALTEKGPFYNSGQDRTEVDVMFQRLKTNHTFDATLQATVVEMLYRGDDYSMVIVLPSERTGVQSLKQNLTIAKLDAVLASLANTNVALHLPKFQLEEMNYPKNHLRSLGLRKMFAGADLSGVTGGTELVVSDVVQRAVLKVDEEGTEAAAVSGVTEVNRMGLETVHIKIDHPFLFFIRNRVSGEIFFAGQVNNL
ncbi:iripin-2-like [Haemaphysalis longicornis]